MGGRKCCHLLLSQAQIRSDAAAAETSILMEDAGIAYGHSSCYTIMPACLEVFYYALFHLRFHYILNLSLT